MKSLQDRMSNYYAQFKAFKWTGCQNLHGHFYSSAFGFDWV